jgi:hypothetical protein
VGSQERPVCKYRILLGSSVFTRVQDNDPETEAVVLPGKKRPVAEMKTLG